MTNTMCGLIEGLPDAVAARCLARVPYSYHDQLQHVCHSWRSFFRSRELFRLRCEVGATEELLCVLAFEPDNVWQLYDPLRDHWMTLPTMPSEIRHLARFGVTSIAGKLFVLGGGSDHVNPQTGDHDGTFATNEVWAYDPLYREWARRADMLVPRAMFACCAVGNKIVVAGGFTNFRKSIPKAEIYDPETDTWTPLPDLCKTHTASCSGILIAGKMHVVHKGLPTVQILQEGGEGWVMEDYGWLQGPMAVVKGEPYVLNGGLIMKQLKKSAFDKVISSASEFKSRISFGMIGLGDEIYLIGGVLGPGPTNQSIKQLRDVDVLAVAGSKPPMWRQAAAMTECCGSILGCALLRI